MGSFFYLEQTMGIRITRESEGEKLLRECREAIEKSITGIDRSVSGLEHSQKLRVYQALISRLETRMTAKVRRKAQNLYH